MSITIKDVFVIPEREDDIQKLGMRIGVAFMNKDDSLNVILDATPMSGKLHIRERKPTNKQQQKGPYV
jgi:hypothetical protein